MASLQPDIQAIFTHAVELCDEQERLAYLESVCAEHSAARDRVAALLKAYEEAGNFLAGEGDCASLLNHSDVGSAGQQIGPYKLRELLGEGGMGEVYVAEQTEPVRRKAALKIVKLGLASREVVARFEAERQALALMDHPHIAKVFDGGTTESGQPYFVMELVQGPPITEYCDKRRLPTQARLELFLKVCQAVQHAHQKGIIHRDLKPSNILVSEIDGRAVPKVIDFGVAKATEQKLTERTIYTQFSQMIGTPLYMSPEQAGFGVVDVDTRSDVYSLGVLLYELLTGALPFDRETLRRAPLDEQLRIIREREPRRPSATVHTLDAAELSTVAEKRGTEPAKLAGALRGELDWIVMRCLEKDRNRRYQAASALAEDVERYLDNGLVEARPSNAYYRLSKFVSRNRGVVLSTVAVFAALSIGLILAATGYVTAEQRLAEANRERENSQLFADLLKDMYPSQWGISELDRQRTVYESVDELSASLSERLRGHPSVEIEARKTFAGVYEAAREVDKARDQLQMALELATREYGPRDLFVGEIYTQLAGLSGLYSQTAIEVEMMLFQAERAIEIYESHGLDAPVTAWFAKQYCLRAWPERKDEAEAACREYVRLSRKKSSGEPVIPQWDLGLLLMDQGRFEEAQVVLEKALRTCRTGDASPTITATVLSGIGKNFRFQGDVEAAKAAFLEAWSLHTENDLHNEPRGRGIGLELVEILFVAGDVEQAFELVQALDRLAVDDDRFDLAAESRFAEGWLHFNLDNLDEAEALFREAIQLARTHIGEDDPRFDRPAFYLALTWERQGKAVEAEPLFDMVRSGLQKRIERPIVNHTASWIYVRSVLGVCGNDETQLRAAEHVARQAMRDVVARPYPWCVAAFQLELAKIAQRRGESDSATAALRDGLASSTEPLATLLAARNLTPCDRRELEVALADLLVDSGPEGPASATKVLEEGVAVRSRSLGDDHIQVALAKLRLGEFRIARLQGDARSHGAHDLTEVYDRLASTRSTGIAPIRKRVALRLAAYYREVDQPTAAAAWRQRYEELAQPVDGSSRESSDPADSISPSAKPPPDELRAAS